MLPLATKRCHHFTIVDLWNKNSLWGTRACKNKHGCQSLNHFYIHNVVVIIWTIKDG